MIGLCQRPIILIHPVHEGILEANRSLRSCLVILAELFFDFRDSLLFFALSFLSPLLAYSPSDLLTQYYNVYIYNLCYYTLIKIIIKINDLCMIISFSLFFCEQFNVMHWILEQTVFSLKNLNTRLLSS